MTNVLRPTIAPAALATAIAILLAAGCGGSSKHTGKTGTASASAKSPMVARADAICKGLNQHRQAANKEVGAVTSVAALRKVAEVAPFLQAFEHSALVELRKLTPPSELASTWRKILAGTELLAAHAGKLGEAASAKNLKAVEVLIHEDQKSEKELIPLAAKAGFQHCGRNV
jgi:hypothetical protein